MTKAQRYRMDLKPVTDILRGWSFTEVARRRAMVARAKEKVSSLPSYIQQAALDEISAIEVHC